MENILSLCDYEDVEHMKELENINERVTTNLYNLVSFDKEVDELIKGLSRLKKSNVLILGKAGVGKTSLVEKLASKINAGTIPKQLKNKTIYELSLNSLLAGTRYRGDFEQKVDKILNIIKDDKDIILFVDEVHNFLNCGDTNDNKGSMSLGDTFKPYLANNRIKLIGATTIEEYNEYIRPNKAFDRRFYKMILKEPSIDKVLEMLIANQKQYEDYYDIKLSIEDLERVIKKAKRKKGTFPDKAFDELEEYCYVLSKKMEG